MLPVLVVINIMYREQEKILTDQISDTLNELIEQNNLVIESEIERISQQTTSIILDSATQNVRTESEQYDFQINREIRYLDNLLTNYSITDQSGLNYQLIFPDNELSEEYTYQLSNISQGNILFVDDVDTSDWYARAINNKGVFSIETIEMDDESTIALTRAINDLSNYGNTLGVLTVTNVENLLIENLGNSISYEIIPYLLNERGEVIFKENEVSNEIISDETLEQLSQPEVQDFISIIDDEIFIKESNETYNFSILFRVPLDQLTEQQAVLRNSAVVLTILYLLIAIFVAYYTAKTYILPLQKLARFFRFYIPGNITEDFRKYEGKGEIGKLMIAVQNLSHRVNWLIKDKYQAEMKSKEIELKMLHEQINPHLLYNTLESIQWNSIMNEDWDTASMINDLSSLLRIGLSKGEGLITLEDEIKHVEAYVNLQKKRYDYRFTFENNISDTIHQLLVPKITLQPLVENSIKYGIKNMGDEGKITLQTIIRDDKFELIVSDNGFKDVDVKKINNSLQRNQKNNGVGTYNVDERIKHHFGAMYGLRFERERDKTYVRITLPVKHGRKEK